MHQLFLFYSEAETGFHSRERAALIWVWCLYTLPQTHPLSPSLSLSLRIPRIPLRLWHLPHTTWFDEGNSLEHAFRERENGLKKKRGREKEKQRALLFLPTTGSWRSSSQTDTHTCHEPPLQEAQNNTDPLCPIFCSPSSDSLIRFPLNLCSLSVSVKEVQARVFRFRNNTW